jgi:hypothetical protein
MPVLGQVGDRRFAQRHAALQSQNIHPFFAVQQEVNHFRRRLRVFRRFANRQHLRRLEEQSGIGGARQHRVFPSTSFAGGFRLSEYLLMVEFHM